MHSKDEYLYLNCDDMLNVKIFDEVSKRLVKMHKDRWFKRYIVN